MGNDVKQLRIEKISIDKLKEYANNPRVNDDAAVKLQKSITKYGFQVPILIDKDNVIVAGHTRYKAAKALGMSQLPCIRIECLTEQQIKAFRIADNKYSEISFWDIDKLTVELSFLKECNEIDDLGFSKVELGRVFDGYNDSLVEKFGTFQPGTRTTLTTEGDSVVKALPSFSNDEESTSDGIYHLRFRNYLIFVSPEEKAEFKRRLNNYKAAHGTASGFIGSLL